MAYGMSGKVFHAPFFEAHKGFQLKAVVERTKKLAKNDYPETISYDNAEALLGDGSIDLIVVNTPNNLHFEHAMQALSANKHVLIEKPACSNTQELQALLDKAQSVGRKIFFYQNRRWDSDFMAVKNVIESEALGKLNEVHFRFDRYREGISVKAFKEEPIAASGLLYDLGPHLLDQAISIWGRPSHWNIVKGMNRPGTKVDDFFSIHLAYPDSLNVFVHSNMMTVAPQPAYVLYGSKGTFVKDRTDVQEEQLQKGIKPTNEYYGIEQANVDGQLSYFEDGKIYAKRIPSLRGDYMSLFDAIYDTLIDGKPYPITNSDVVAQLEIIQSAS